MKKRELLLLLIIMTLLVSMCGCGQVEIDISSMANTIKEQVEFEDEMEEIPFEIVSTVYGLDIEEIEIESYFGSGATAEEITVINCKDSKNTNKVYEIAQKHIEQQKEEFKNYNPKELDKLDNAVIIKKDKYVIVCVTNNNEDANKVINDKLK